MAVDQMIDPAGGRLGQSATCRIAREGDRPRLYPQASDD
jgi:hypothetical protein